MDDVYVISGFIFERFRKNSLEKELTHCRKLTIFCETHAKNSPKTEIFANFCYVITLDSNKKLVLARFFERIVIFLFRTDKLSGKE